MVNYSGAYAAPRADLGEAFMEHVSDMTEFIGLQVLPTFRTTKKAATYSAITRESILQDSAASRAARSAYNRINSGAKDKTYSCEEFGLEQVVDDAERTLYASDFDAEAAATKITARALMLQQEKRAAAAVFDTAVWTGASYFLDTTTVWSDVSANIIGDVLTAKETARTNCGVVPNALILNEANLRYLLQNTGIKAQFPGAPLVTLEMIRAALVSIFGLRKLIVAGAVRNSALEGQTATIANVWSSSYAMVACVAEEGDPLQTPCIGRTFLWVPDSPSEITVEMYREEQVRGDVVRARHNLDEVIIDKNFGFLLKVD